MKITVKLKNHIQTTMEAKNSLEEIQKLLNRINIAGEDISSIPPQYIKDLTVKDKQMVKVIISFDESFIGCHRTVSFVNKDNEECEIEVDIPPNVYNGQQIELEECIIIIAIQPHPRKWRSDKEGEEGVIYFHVDYEHRVAHTSSGKGLLIPMGDLERDITYRMSNPLLEVAGQEYPTITASNKPESLITKEEKEMQEVDVVIEKNNKILPERGIMKNIKEKQKTNQSILDDTMSIRDNIASLLNTNYI